MNPRTSRFRWLMLATLCLCPIPGIAGAPFLSWERRYNTLTDTECRVIKSTVDSAGNSVVIGYTDLARAGRDIVTIKYSATGTALWTNFYNGQANGDDEPRAVAVAPG